MIDTDLPRVGGKAFNCGRLRRAGFPVPDGLAIPSDAPDADVQQLAGHPWFAAVGPEALFAVRSSGLGEDSAGHSFAGLHETQLNVDRSRLIDAVRACRQSSGSAAARAYREARALHDEEPHIGVLVQLMVPAVTSGVAFTVNPITGADELVINAARGLGEALVSGQIDPDEYRVRKSDGTVLSARLGAHGADDRVPTLSDEQLNSLATLLTAVEHRFGAPQDIEWCHDGRQFWLVQSRPVTTGPSSLTTEVRRPNSPDPEWTRANLIEVLPDQLSPQALGVYVDLLNRGERAFFGRLMAPEAELGPILRAFHGRLYFNLSQLRHVTESVGAAPADTLRSLGHPEKIRPEDEIARRPPIGRFVRVLPDVLRLVRHSLRIEQVFSAHQAETEQILARLNAVEPASQSDLAIVAMFDWWIAIAPETLTPVFVMSSVQFHEDVLRKASKAAGCSYDRLVYPQLAAGERSVSTQQAVDLVELARAARDEEQTLRYLHLADDQFTGFRNALHGTVFLAQFDRFLERYGHRGRYESDWALPRLHENPQPALFAIRALVQGTIEDPQVTAQRQAADAAEAMRAFEARLSTWQRWTLLPRVRSALRKLKRQYVMREAVRSNLTRVVSRVRAWHLVLANRFVERGWLDRRDDYFLLEIGEVRQAVSDPAQGPALRGFAARRAAQLAAERDLRLPLFMRESELPALLRTSSAVTGDGELTGLCVSPGAVEADVVVMRDPSEFAAMTRGAILVAPATDPSWTPLFTLAAGVIVEVGGMLSHASTIAREYGLPALANVKDATRVLKTGDRVRLDASNGRVVRVGAK